MAPRNPVLPPREDLYPPTMQALKQMGGSANIEELNALIADLMDLSEEVRAVRHASSNMSQIDYDLAWVRTLLKRAGAVENSQRGVWHITPAGREMTDEELRTVRLRFRSRRSSGKSGNDDPDVTDETDTPIAEIEWQERLLSVLQSLDPSAFERLCQRLLRESGFVKVEVTGRSGDGGIDGVGVLRLNLLSFHVSFQCKKWAGSVGSSVVRDFRGAMIGRSDKGLILTTGTFTADARREATRDGAPAIDLVDGDTLCDLLKDLRLGVVTRMIEQIEIDEQTLRAI